MNWIEWECCTQNGDWQLGPKAIEVHDIEKRDIYTSPWEPGFVCWVCLWKEVDGALKCAFTEAKGDPAMWPPGFDFRRSGLDYYAKPLVSHDGSQNWIDTGWVEPQDRRWKGNSDHHWRKTVVMPDNSFLRVMPHTLEDTYEERGENVYDPALEGKKHGSLPKTFPFERREGGRRHAKRTAVWRSDDGGRGWQEIYCDPDRRFWATGLLRCREGHLVKAGVTYTSDYSDSGGVAVSESLDGGFTWSEPQPVVTSQGSMQEVKFTEESDMVQLQDGRIFSVSRTSGKTDYGVQACVTRTGPGAYRAEQIGFTPIYHASNPILLRTSDGTIWFAGDACNQFVTADDGYTWEEFEICWTYYAQMLEVEPGCLLNISQYAIGDSPYPHATDSSIRQTRLRYARADVLEQRDPAATAFCMVDAHPRSDAHLHLWVRAQGTAGLAFRGQERASYVYLIETRAQDDSSQHTGKLDLFHLLGRVDGDQLAVLRRRYIGEVSAGKWLQMQVRTADDLLQGAILMQDALGRESAHFLSARDVSLVSGQVGIGTFRSAGAFKALRILPPSRPIREGWWKKGATHGRSVL